MIPCSWSFQGQQRHRKGDLWQLHLNLIDSGLGETPELFLTCSSCGLQGTAVQGVELDQGQQQQHIGSFFQQLLLQPAGTVGWRAGEGRRNLHTCLSGVEQEQLWGSSHAWVTSKKWVTGGSHPFLCLLPSWSPCVPHQPGGSNHVLSPCVHMVTGRSAAPLFRKS